MFVLYFFLPHILFFSSEMDAGEAKVQQCANYVQRIRREGDVGRRGLFTCNKCAGWCEEKAHLSILTVYITFIDMLLAETKLTHLSTVDNAVPVLD